MAIGIDGIIATSTSRCIGSYGVPGLNPASFSHSPIHLSSINFATQTVFMLVLCAKSSLLCIGNSSLRKNFVYTRGSL